MANDAIHIVGVTVRNFRRLTVARIEHVPDVGLVRVTGPNAAGKTSLLRAIAGALGGAGEVHPDSLTHGAGDDGGVTSLRLSNGFTIERRMTAANPKGYLTITGPDGGRHGQAKLDEWCGPRSFDPMGFLALPPDRQRDVLFGIGTDPDLPRKIAAARDHAAEIYATRTPVIVRVRELRKVEPPEGERPTPVDMDEIRSELARHEDARRTWESRARAVDEAREAVDAVDGAIAEADAEIAELTRALERARKERGELDRLRADTVSDAAEAMAVFERTPDPTGDIKRLQERRDAAGAIQRALYPWHRWDETVAALAEATKDEARLTEALEAARAAERALLADAGIPIADLGFADDGSPLIGGVPLALASGRERIDLAVRVALAADPSLRVCLLDEANDLDPAAMERLADLARTHGFQVWAVRIGIEGPGDVVVDDGHAIDRDAPVTIRAADPKTAAAECLRDDGRTVTMAEARALIVSHPDGCVCTIGIPIHTEGKGDGNDDDPAAVTSGGSGGGGVGTDGEGNDDDGDDDDDGRPVPGVHGGNGGDRGADL